MTEQEQKAFDAMREALEHCEDSLQSVGLTITASIANEALTAANAVSQPQVTEPAEKEDPLQGAVDWLLQADGEFFAVATVQRTLRIGYNRAKRLAEIARERAAAPEAHHGK